MFVSAIKKVKESMFPIFRIEHLSGSQVNIGVVGTGFFISEDGKFISVCHIFDTTTSVTDFYYRGKLPDEVINPAIEITEIARNDDADIYIGKINVVSIPLSISDTLPDIGRSICISGYPLAELRGNSQGGLDLSGVRRYFQPSFVLDWAIANVDNGLGKIRKHDGFIVRDFGLFGMSGGPVFDVDGSVVGVQGSITPPRTSTNGTRSILIENAHIIKSPIILDLLRDKNISLN